MICTLCYVSSDDLIFLAGDEGQRLQVSSILFKHFRFCFDDEPIDGSVCRKCWWKVDMFHEFYVQIEQIHGSLQRVDTVFAESVDIVDDVKVEVAAINSSFDIKQEQSPESDGQSDSDVFASDPNDSDDWTPDVKKLNKNAGKPKQTKCKRRISTRSNKVTSNQMQQEKNPLECEVCLEIFLTLNRVERHKKLTHFALPFKCVQRRCIESFESVELLKEHVRIVHVQSECPQCGRMIMSRHLHKHIRDEHNPAKHVECNLCGKVSNNKQSHKDHMRIKHNANEKLQCDICKAWYKNRNNIHDHLLYAHVKDEQKCDICGKILQNMTALKMHQAYHRQLEAKKEKKLNKPKEQKLQCEVCHEYFLTRKEFERHKKLTHLALPFRCLYFKCVESFETAEILEEHRRNVHVRSPCSRCGKMILASRLKTHFREECDPAKRVVCDQCGKVSNNKRLHRQHLRTEHVVQEKVQCDICKEWYKHKKVVLQHLLLYHVFDKQTCEICGFVAQNRWVLYVHKKSHKPVNGAKKPRIRPKKPKKEPKPPKVKKIADKLANKVKKEPKQKKFKTFQCEVCLEYFLTKRSLLRHQHYTHLALPFKCTSIRCKQSFLTAEKLEEHKTNDHARIKCPICGKSIGAAKELLQEHIARMHDIDHQVICEQCGKVCYNAYQHKYHVEMEHETHAKVQCDICKDWFKNKHCIRSHIKTIHLEEPIPCQDCGKVYPNSKALRSHRTKVHMKPTKECMVCGKFFNSNGRLKEHLAIHTGVTDIHECSICGKKFRFSSSLSLHRMKEHPIEMADIKQKMERRKRAYT